MVAPSGFLSPDNVDPRSTAPGTRWTQWGEGWTQWEEVGPNGGPNGGPNWDPMGKFDEMRKTRKILVWGGLRRVQKD